MTYFSHTIGHHMTYFFDIRSAGFPSLKKDATSFAGRLIQPVLQLLNNDGAEAVWVSLICQGFCGLFLCWDADYKIMEL